MKDPIERKFGPLMDKLTGEWPERDNLRDYLLGDFTGREWLHYALIAACTALTLLALVQVLPVE